jgi:lipopolysaccharide/colanic/teichoic acid biosynthesis glycosyltransferase
MMLKRAIDIVFSAGGLIILSPLLLILAAAVAFTSPGGVFYRANRVGRGGVPFKLYKFRSMVADADKRGPAVTVAGDRRVTPVGKFLRKTKLDELPQLLNVLKGDMSLVGPRPEDPRYVALYTPEQRAVLNVRPGITSLASVTYRDEESLLTGADWEKLYIETIMPAKIAIDLAYVARATPLEDVKIILRTVGAILR